VKQNITKLSTAQAPLSTYNWPDLILAIQKAVRRQSQRVWCIACLRLQPQAMTDNKYWHRPYNRLNLTVAIQKSMRSQISKVWSAAKLRSLISFYS